MRTGAKDRAAYYLTLCKHSLSIQCEILFVLQSGIKSSLDFRCHSRSFIIPGCPVRHIQLYHDNILSLYRRKISWLVERCLCGRVAGPYSQTNRVYWFCDGKSSPPPHPGAAVHPFPQLTNLETSRKLGRVNFRKDFWDCYCGQEKKLANKEFKQ